MDTVYIHGLMEISMKENGRISSSMEQGLKTLLMVTSTLDSTTKACHMELDNIDGQMGLYTLGISTKDLNRVEESGRRIVIK